MKIIVCIKQVPNTTEIKIDPVTNTLKRDGIPSIMNPDDKSALEYALSLKESLNATVTTITMGPPQAEKMLRESLAMGADEAVLLTDRAFAGSDTWATSTIIANAIKKLGYDLIIAGRQAIDGDTAQVGPQIAEHLHLPQVTYVASVTGDSKELIVKRQLEDRYQMLKVKLPALLTVLGGSNSPRYMTVGGIVDQAEQQIKVMTFADLDVDVSDIGLKGSPTKVHSTFAKQLSGDKQLVETDSNSASDLIIETLKQQHII